MTQLEDGSLGGGLEHFSTVPKISLGHETQNRRRSHSETKRSLTSQIENMKIHKNNSDKKLLRIKLSNY